MGLQRRKMCYVNDYYFHKKALMYLDALTLLFLWKKNMRMISGIVNVRRCDIKRRFNLGYCCKAGPLSLLGNYILFSFWKYFILFLKIFYSLLDNISFNYQKISHYITFSYKSIWDFLIVSVKCTGCSCSLLSLSWMFWEWSCCKLRLGGIKSQQGLAATESIITSTTANPPENPN